MEFLEVGNGVHDGWPEGVCIDGWREEAADAREGGRRVGIICVIQKLHIALCNYWVTYYNKNY